MSEFDTQLAALTAANASLQTAIGKMNNLMTASELSDVTIEGVTKPSIAKQVKTKTDPTVANLNTAVASLNSLMTASAETSVTVSGQVVPSIAKSLHNWLDDSDSRLANLTYLLRVQIPQAVSTNGEALNGAQFWDGTTTSGANSASGGWYIAAGVSGGATYNRYLFSIPATVLPSLLGKIVRFVVTLKTSDFLFDSTTFSTAGVSPTAGLVAGSIVRAQVARNTAIVAFDYLVTASDVSIIAQLSTSSTGTIRHCHCTSMSYCALDGSGAYTALDLAAAKYAVTLNSKDYLPDYTKDSQIFNGASKSTHGIAVPAGSTGLSSYTNWRVDVSNFPVGEKITLVAELTTSTDLLAKYSTKSVGINGNLGTSLHDAGSITTTVDSPTKITLRGVYTIRASQPVQQVGLYLQLAGTALDTTQERQFSASRLYLNSGNISNMINLIVDDRLSGVVINPVPRIVTVRPDGTGDYLTLKLACEMEGDATASEPLEIRVSPGVYTDTNYYIPNNTKVTGLGMLGDVWLRGELPADTDPSIIRITQTIWLNETSTLENLKITAKNMRYPIHSDSGSSAKKATQIIDRCLVEHYGNQEAVDHQLSINSGASVWSADHAFGCGTHSGEYILSKNTIWRSRVGAFSIHTNRDFAEPSIVDIDGGELQCTGDGYAIKAEPLGSGKADQLRVKNAVINGAIWYSAYPWLALQSPQKTKSNHNELSVEIVSPQPLAILSATQADNLMLSSASGSNSSIQLSGSALIPLFGYDPLVKLGANRLAAIVVSDYNINTVNGGQSLGSRLGDCLASSKVLNVVFDGVINKTVTLSANYTASSNADIVAILNSQIADATRLFSITKYYSGRATIRQTNFDRYVKNTSADGIKRGEPVAYNGRDGVVKVMETTDPAAAFAGIAIDDILPGESGFVSKRTFFSIEISRASLSSLWLAQAEVVSTGVVGLGTSRPIMQCIDVTKGLWKCL